MTQEMNREELLDYLLLRIEAIDNLPPKALFEPVNYYEFISGLRLVYDIFKAFL